jgi:glycine betaine/proline transport system substrate-binding protein
MNFDDQGKTQNPQLHFFQVQGRVFKETFARKVGTGPQVSQAATDTKTTVLEQSFAPDKAPITFAGLNWNSALFGNSIARFIIESGYGYPTYAVNGSSVPLFQSLQKGDIHVYMEVWLPNTQELYDNALANNQVIDLGLYFGDAVQGWFVPKYVVEGDSKRNIEAVAPDLNSVEDLKRYAHLFASQEQPGIGRLLDGSPGWFSYKIDCMKLKAYRLDDKYAQVTTGSGSVLFTQLSNAYENGKPILLYLFGPSWPMAKFDLKQLKEPEFTQECWNTDKGCEFPLNQVKIVVYKTLPQRAPEVAEFLGKFQLESEAISQVLLLMQEKDLTPEDAALIWLKDHEEIWSQWVTAEAAQKVKQMLSK